MIMGQGSSAKRARMALRCVLGVLFSVSVFACGGSDTTPPKLPPPTSSDGGAVLRANASASSVRDDDFAYLEDVSGDKALAFARAHNAVSKKELTEKKGFRALESRLFSIFSSKEKIPRPQMAHDSVRNFWTDADHPRGLWRQTTLADYKTAKPTWTTLLDVDALGKAENESFVFKQAPCLPPLRKKCLVQLSRGGGDAVVVREFDTDKKAFVSDGFVVPEGKTVIAWKDENTLYVGADSGAGSLTKSGYPRTIREWKRGAPLASAPVVFEVKENDIEAACSRDFDHGKKRDFCERVIDFEHTEVSMFQNGKLVKLEKPEDADYGTWDTELVFRLRSDWSPSGKIYRKGSLIITGLDAFMAGKRDFQVLFEPTKQSSLAGWSGTKTRIVVNVLSDVKNQVTTFARREGRWIGTPLKETVGAVNVDPLDAERSDDTWLWLEDFTVPHTLSLWNVATGKREPLKQNPAFFDTSNLAVEQHFATSKDGTKVPYFEVARKGRTVAVPTLLQAYGGFEISLPPAYMPNFGAGWLERGAALVVANIRGGGEYGPAWHEAAMKSKRQNAYDDLAAVAEDLTRRGVTTASKLGVMGGSNGGLLTSVMLTQRPELFGAVVSMVPLTDMKRFHKLLAGASWMGEYGDPDNAEDWAVLAKFSPFQNIRAGMKYPPMFYTASTKDDRVHPAHARKMVAKLEAMGFAPLYYENIEGGHGGAADIKQRAYRDALIYTFLATRLGAADYESKAAAPGR